MTLWAEFMGNLLATLAVSGAHPYACAGSCPWLAAGPRCRLWPQRLQWAGVGLPRRALDCIGAGFEQFAAPAWITEAPAPASATPTPAPTADQ